MEIMCIKVILKKKSLSVVLLEFCKWSKLTVIKQSFNLQKEDNLKTVEKLCGDYSHPLPSVARVMKSAFPSFQCGILVVRSGENTADRIP